MFFQMNKVSLIMALIVGSVSDLMVYALILHLIYKTSPAHAAFIVTFGLMTFISKIIIGTHVKELNQ